MRFHVLATDYDGTLAHDGVVDPATVAALEEVRGSGRRLVLVTGREVDDLLRVFPDLSLFDEVVAENGAVLYTPASKARRALAEPPPPPFVEALRARGVTPLGVGQVIVATHQPHEILVLEVIRQQGLELQVTFNKGAVMVLPSGVNKAFGLAAALAAMGLSPHNAVGIGDAENDHSLLAACECAVAVANALPTLKERADWVTVAKNGAGVRELALALVASDLAEVGQKLERHFIAVGTRADGGTLRISPYGPPILVAGTSGAGKSTLATALLEQLAEAAYQLCIVDPEGDYADVDLATVIGEAGRPASITEILEILERLALPPENVVANLLGIGLADRPAFFEGLFLRLQELRARTGRPHWIVVDEAHHLLPEGWGHTAGLLPRELDSLLLITVHPEHIAPALLAQVGLVLVIGVAPAVTLASFAGAIGKRAPDVPAEPLPVGEAYAWDPRAGGPAVRVRLRPPHTERRRHVRKYAAGELGPDKSFYFRGPAGRLNLRAQNLQMFLQVADGVDDETWLYHLRGGDYSRWLRQAIKDEGLADEVARLEADPSLSAPESRARVHAAIEQRYTAPA